MRVLIISDIHRNAAALEAVLAQPHDVLVCLGDLVGYGPAPGAVVRHIRAEATLVLQGNHDRALADGVAPGCRAAFESLARATAPLGTGQLSPEEIADLGSLPRSAIRTFDGVNCLFVHATPGDALYRYLLDDPEEWEREVAELDVDLVIVGHTHRQFELDLARWRVVNPGSATQGRRSARCVRHPRARSRHAGTCGVPRRPDGRGPRGRGPARGRRPLPGRPPDIRTRARGILTLTASHTGWVRPRTLHFMGAPGHASHTRFRPLQPRPAPAGAGSGP